VSRNDVTLEGALRRWIQLHERGLVVGWLAGCALLLAVLGAWGIGANGAERAVDELDSGWVRELNALAERVRKQEFEAVLPRLERLDGECPANFVKHRFDKEREQLLGLLAQCYAELDRRKPARDTLHRLVAFDPHNFDNHFRLAEAERAFGDELAARASYEQVLAIHPSHLPSLQATIEMAFADGRHADVVAAYERYLDAWLLGSVKLRCGDQVIELESQVDGRERVVEGLLSLPADWSGQACLETSGFSARIASIELAAPVLAGESRAAPSVRWTPDATWTAASGTSAVPGELSAGTIESSLCGTASAANGAARVRVTLTLFKALPAPLWSRVRASYRNQLAFEALDGAEKRSLVGGCLAGGSTFVD
jgi:tetratricopeptide (TPR) repeat protein